MDAHKACPQSWPCPLVPAFLLFVIILVLPQDHAWLGTRPCHVSATCRTGRTKCWRIRKYVCLF